MSSEGHYCDTEGFGGEDFPTPPQGQPMSDHYSTDKEDDHGIPYAQTKTVYVVCDRPSTMFAAAVLGVFTNESDAKAYVKHEQPNADVTSWLGVIFTGERAFLIDRVYGVPYEIQHSYEPPINIDEKRKQILGKLSPEDLEFLNMHGLR